MMKDFATKKSLMVVSTSIGASCESGEPIQVELALEGSELGLHEEARHNIVHKLILLVNGEASPMGLPRDDVSWSMRFSIACSLSGKCTFRPTLHPSSGGDCES